MVKIDQMRKDFGIPVWPVVVMLCWRFAMQHYFQFPLWWHGLMSIDDANMMTYLNSWAALKIFCKDNIWDFGGGNATFIFINNNNLRTFQCVVLTFEEKHSKSVSLATNDDVASDQNVWVVCVSACLRTMNAVHWRATVNTARIIVIPSYWTIFFNLCVVVLVDWEFNLSWLGFFGWSPFPSQILLLSTYQSV